MDSLLSRQKVPAGSTVEYEFMSLACNSLRSGVLSGMCSDMGVAFWPWFWGKPHYRWIQNKHTHTQAPSRFSAPLDHWTLAGRTSSVCFHRSSLLFQNSFCLSNFIFNAVHPFSILKLKYASYLMTKTHSLLNTWMGFIVPQWLKYTAKKLFLFRFLSYSKYLKIKKSLNIKNIVKYCLKNIVLQKKET